MPWYFIAVSMIFIVPSIGMYWFLYPRLSPVMRTALAWTMAISIPSDIIVELVYMAADTWNFSEIDHPYIGLYFLGVPIEEFLFWCGASVFFTLLYLTFDYLDKNYLRKERTPHAVV